MVRHEKITKLGAAERQLRIAIRLFFERADLIAVHTLAAAATQVLVDVGKSRGVTSPFRDNDIIRPEKKKEWTIILNEAQNFFKHADRDPGGMLDFYPDATPFHIFEGVLMHNAITKGYFPETLVFASWFSLKYPYLLLDGPLKTKLQAGLGQSINLDDFEVVQDVLEFLNAQYVAGQWPPKT